MKAAVEDEKPALRGMRGFTIIWIGQLVSMLGSGMTAFGVSIWAWELTGKATALSLAFFFGFAPMVLFSPVAGAIVDRSSRKKVMILSDLGAGLSTVALLVLLWLGNLQIWHLYAANFFASFFGAFQFPAYSAAVSTMLDKKHYGRASGMMGMAGSASGILAPIFAGAMIGVVGLRGIMLFDVVTFIFAISMLLIVNIPQPKQSAAGAAARSSLRKESGFGFKYIFSKPSLLGMQLVFFAINLTAMFGITLTVPMILARTGNDSLLLGSAQSIGAIGGVLGGLVLSVWGGPKRRVHGVLFGMILVSLLGGLPMGIGRTLSLWAAALFASNFILPFLNGSNQAIWQAKVPPDIQGRVFATRALIAQISAPIAMLAAGPLADYIFEPAMSGDGTWMQAGFGWLVGTGPGAGMGVMYVITSVLGVLVGCAGYLFPVVRNIEDILPDHDAEAAENAPVVEAPPAVGTPPRSLDPARKAKAKKLLVLREQLLAGPGGPERDKAMKYISQQLREIGRAE